MGESEWVSDQQSYWVTFFKHTTSSQPKLDRKGIFVCNVHFLQQLYSFTSYPMERHSSLIYLFATTDNRCDGVFIFTTIIISEHNFHRSNFELNNQTKVCFVYVCLRSAFCVCVGLFVSVWNSHVSDNPTTQHNARAIYRCVWFHEITWG